MPGSLRIGKIAGIDIYTGSRQLCHDPAFAPARGVLAADFE
jgi:hypothetical protein